MEEAMLKPRRAIVIHSPYSGRSAQLPETLIYLKQAGIEIAEIASVATLDGLPPQGTRWMDNGFDIAIAAGGDGLVGSVITHIAASGLLLGILPLGTANDIARSIDIPQDLQQAAAVIASGRVVEIDIGIAQPAEQAPHAPGIMQENPIATQLPSYSNAFFAHALTVGVNVQFARMATNIATRKHYGRLTYPITALEILKSRTPLDMELHFEGLALPSTTAAAQAPAQRISEEDATVSCRVLQATVINAPIFGGAWRFTVPGASLNDRLLDIVLVEDANLEHLNALMAQFFAHQTRNAAVSSEQSVSSLLQQAELTNVPGIHHVQARGVHIITNADPQDATLDGEIRGQTPIYARVAKERLRVVGS
jgi:diacylglycerol kinase family enzyme